jgi:hypothetical protein
MSTQVIVTLDDEVFREAKRLAEQSGRDIGELIATTFGIAVTSLRQPSQPIETLTDEEVLSLAESRMDATLNARMSELLDKQQSGKLNESEEHELSLLIYVYQEGSLRKADALLEANRRGLSPQLSL